jgi:predicted amidohydrolase
MNPPRLRRHWISALALFPAVGRSTPIAPGDVAPPAFHSRADSPPRKIVVASAVADFHGSVEARLALVARLTEEAARRSAGENAGRGLDLMVFPEFAICREAGATAAERSVPLSGVVRDQLATVARQHHTWLIVPMTLREADAPDHFSNAAVLLDRAGAVAGIFRKVHPVADERGVFEGGVTPGSSYPVFDCDFGRLGILICWDMAYDESWDALAAAGAEIVALPSASPQTIRPAAAALRHHFYVVNSAPRQDATVFDPIGRIIAQQTSAPGVVVRRIDLAYAILHWSETLHNGQAFTGRYGERAGYDYSEREDTGIFWSNDPQTSVGTMIRELGLREMPEVIAQTEDARRRAAAAGPRR